MLCDLHIHSDFSSGNQSLKEIIEEALSKNIKLISITDDDSTDAYDTLDEIIKLYNISYIKGVQITAQISGMMFRLLAYDFDEKSDELQQLLQYNREIWEQFQIEIVEILRGKYPELSVEEYIEHQKIRSYGGFKYNSYLYSKGFDGREETTKDIFLKYKDEFIELMKNQKFKPVQEVIDAIHSAGGVAIVPGGYLRNIETLEVDMKNLVDMGVDGFECISPSYDEQFENVIYEFASKKELLITGGGDGHGSWANQNKYGIGIKRIEDSIVQLGLIKIH